MQSARAALTASGDARAYHSTVMCAHRWAHSHFSLALQQTSETLCGPLRKKFGDPCYRVSGSPFPDFDFFLYLRELSLNFKRIFYFIMKTSNCITRKVLQCFSAHDSNDSIRLHILKILATPVDKSRTAFFPLDSHSTNLNNHDLILNIRAQLLHGGVDEVNTSPGHWNTFSFKLNPRSHISVWFWRPLWTKVELLFFFHAPDSHSTNFNIHDLKYSHWFDILKVYQVKHSVIVQIATSLKKKWAGERKTFLGSIHFFLQHFRIYW